MCTWHIQITAGLLQVFGRLKFGLLLQIWIPQRIRLELPSPDMLSQHYYCEATCKNLGYCLDMSESRPTFTELQSLAFFAKVSGIVGWLRGDPIEEEDTKASEDCRWWRILQSVMLSLRHRDIIDRHPQSGMSFWACSRMHGWSLLLDVQDAQKVLANGPRHRLMYWLWNEAAVFPRNLSTLAICKTLWFTMICLIQTFVIERFNPDTSIDICAKELIPQHISTCFHPLYLGYLTLRATRGAAYGVSQASPSGGINAVWVMPEAGVSEDRCKIAMVFGDDGWIICFSFNDASN